MLDFDLVERDLELGPLLIVLRSAEHFAKEDFRDLDAPMLGLQAGDEPLQVRRASWLVERLLEDGRGLIELGEVEEVVEADVEVVSPVVGMMLDRPLQKADPLPHLLRIVGQPDRGEAVGMSDVWIEGRDDVDAAAELAGRLGTDTVLAARELNGL